MFEKKSTASSMLNACQLHAEADMKSAFCFFLSNCGLVTFEVAQVS